MIEIHFSETSQNPLYQQIAEQIKQLIAAGRLQPGEHLPTVRQLAHFLHVNPGTVVRAYLQLEQEGMVVSRHGGGTIVSAGADDPRTSVLRRGRLSNMVSGNILEALSLGYSPEELEAAFSLHLARWREERKDKEKASGARGGRTGSRNSFLIVGSNDLALNLLVSKLKHRNPEINIEVTNAGSLGGLIALREGRADLAGIHLLDEESGEYNYPYVKHVLPGVEMAIVHFTYRIQGFMFAKGNPKQIRRLEDLRRPEVTMVNRQKGSGTRVLLDFKLRESGIPPRDIKGYQHEEDTHLAVAGSIARGEADVGLGIEAAARSRGTDFLPLFRERYDLVIPVEKCRSKPVLSLLEITKSEEFRKVVTEMGGYDTSETGTTVFVS